jgi:hypothetical protein
MKENVDDAWQRRDTTRDLRWKSPYAACMLAKHSHNRWQSAFINNSFAERQVRPTSVKWLQVRLSGRPQVSQLEHPEQESGESWGPIQKQQIWIAGEMPLVCIQPRPCEGPPRRPTALLRRATVPALAVSRARYWSALVPTAPGIVKMSTDSSEVGSC